MTFSWNMQAAPQKHVQGFQYPRCHLIWISVLPHVVTNTISCSFSFVLYTSVCIGLPCRELQPLHWPFFEKFVIVHPDGCCKAHPSTLSVELCDQVWPLVFNSYLFVTSPEVAGCTELQQSFQFGFTSMPCSTRVIFMKFQIVKAGAQVKGKLCGGIAAEFR